MATDGSTANPPDEDVLTGVLQELLRATGASRVTLRQVGTTPVAFSVTHEALAPDAGSLRDETTVDLRTQPVAIEVRSGRQVVQTDCLKASDDPEFLRMLHVYGGLAAQIVTPVVRDGTVFGILSVHQLGAPREWTADEVAEASRAAERITEVLDG